MENQRTSNEIDKFVGRRLKQRRDELGLSQEKLADKLGISFQQVQKYERGFNRVGASRLFAIAKELGVTVSYFFESLEDTRPEATQNEIAELLSNKNAIPLLRVFTRMSEATQRKIYELVVVVGA